MADIFSARKRSAIMARVRGRGNERTELALLIILRRHKIIGWRRHTSVFGRPDFVFPQQRLAIFVDGCFWHGCQRHGTKPKTNVKFWHEKIVRNKARDRLVTRTLRVRGWQVLRIWEHDLTKKREAKLLLRIKKLLA